MTVDKAIVTVTASQAAESPEPVIAAAETPPAEPEAFASTAETVTYLVEVLVPLRVVVASSATASTPPAAPDG